MADDSYAMQKLMGFSSFGRPRKRIRRHDDRARGTHVNARVEGDRTERGELHHVVNGTNIQLDGELLSDTSVRITPNGIAMLLNSGQHNTADLTAALGDDGEELQSDAGAARRHLATWSLPPSSMELLKRLEDTKARFGSLDRKAFVAARRGTNPFETLGRHRFINRSAMKMANMDFLFGWTQFHKNGGGENKPFTFADVCGGPGGFSEYLLWRMHHYDGESSASKTMDCTLAVGYGITLKDAPWCDWKVQADDSQCTEFHICNGADGTGDLYKIENIIDFRDAVHERFREGVQLVVADGGFPDARDQSNQELLMTRLILAESLTMFWVLRVGGSFMCKTFELSSPLMLQLLWLLHKCFEEIAIVKPVTSRPASSERYVVAHKMLPNLPLDRVRHNLERLVRALGKEDPLQHSLFSMETPRSSAWLDFAVQASDRLAKEQIAACEKIFSFASYPADSAERKQDTEPVRPDEYIRAWGL